MNADSCVFCEKPLENGETTTLQEKGCQTALKCSEERGQLVEVYVGQRVLGKEYTRHAEGTFAIRRPSQGMKNARLKIPPASRRRN